MPRSITETSWSLARQVAGWMAVDAWARRIVHGSSREMWLLVSWRPAPKPTPSTALPPQSARMRQMAIRCTELALGVQPRLGAFSFTCCL